MLIRRVDGRVLVGLIGCVTGCVKGCDEKKCQQSISIGWVCYQYHPFQ